MNRAVMSMTVHVGGRDDSEMGKEAGDAPQMLRSWAISI
jgi:hypothetical protein